MAISQRQPLRILITGAGIGGLSAAIALRQAGHIVEIFESSRFATELGAAIHLPPGANGILRRYGITPEDFDCIDVQHVTVYDSQGTVKSTKDLRGLRSLYPHPWQFAHRVDLHEALKSKATSPEGPGTPVTIHLRSKVVSCDPAAPSLTLADGSVVEGDLVIGADGVHSTLRSIIAQEDGSPHPSGGSAFRFLIPVAAIDANPATKDLVPRPGEFQLWDGTYRRLVIYPCRNGTELNFVCLHPDAESQHSTEGWDVSGSQDQLLRIYDEFSPAMKALLAMTDPDSIKLWRLLDRKALRTWVREKACLLGDAAHPFLPHQGQGGAQAIEDGAALAALLPLGTGPDAIPHRLQLYMQARYARATMIQDFSRQAAFKLSPDDSVGGTSTDPLEFMKINFGHDAHDHATNILLRAVGPRLSSSRIGSRSASTASTILELGFRARRNYLETLLPCLEARIVAPGGWVDALWRVTRDIPVGAHKEKPGQGVSVALVIPQVDLTGTTSAAADGKEAKEGVRGGVGEYTAILFTGVDDRETGCGEDGRLPVVPATIEVSMLEGGSWVQVQVQMAGRVVLVLRADDSSGSQLTGAIEFPEIVTGEEWRARLAEGGMELDQMLLGVLQGLEPVDIQVIHSS